MTEIKQWFSGNKDYDTGVIIFAKYTKNRFLARTFQKGTSLYLQSKLEYELGKLNVEIEKQKIVKPEAQIVTPLPKTIEPNQPQKVEYPEVILAAKKEIATMYSIIDKMHTELYDLGSSNADNVVAVRKRILEKRKPICKRVDLIYKLKEEYFRTSGNEQKEVINALKEFIVVEPKQHPAFTPHIANSKISGMNDIELLKRKQALSSAISKAQNIIRYQSIRKADTPTPLPVGPKREKYERKLATLKAEYNQIIKEINLRNKQ